MASCANCGSTLYGPFCSQCGEKKLTRKDYTLPHFIEEVVGVFTHLDTKLFRTLRVLFTKPGELSNAYFRGGRSRYTKPLTLFVIINVIFFVIQPHTGLLRYKYTAYINNNRHFSSVVRTHLLKTKEAEATYAARFNTNLQHQKKSLLVFAVPVLALVMAVLLIGTHTTYVEHLVFAVQVYAFLLAYLLAVVFVIMLPVTTLLRAAGPSSQAAIDFLDREIVITTLTISALTIYMFFGLRRAYDVGRVRAALTAFALAWAVGLLTGVYYTVLFYATYWVT